MRPVFLYDGDCAFCTSCARFIGRRIPTTAELSAWQRRDLGALGVTERQASGAVLWIGTDGTVSAGPEAIADLLVDAGSGWRLLGRVLALRPVRWMAWPAYRWVSRHRSMLPGATPACALPGAERR